MAKSQSLTIGKVADQGGVNVQTIRYYERRGLLPKPVRSASGYRAYSAEAVRRLRFIRRAQLLGFSRTHRSFAAGGRNRNTDMNPMRWRSQN